MTPEAAEGWTFAVFVSLACIGVTAIVEGLVQKYYRYRERQHRYRPYEQEQVDNWGRLVVRLVLGKWDNRHAAAVETLRYWYSEIGKKSQKHRWAKEDREANREKKLIQASRGELTVGTTTCNVIGRSKSK